MAYIPENKYQVLYTGGREYKFKLTNRSYIGKYLKLSNGKVFAGDHPSRIIGPLISIEPLLNRNIQDEKNNNVYIRHSIYRICIRYFIYVCRSSISSRRCVMARNLRPTKKNG